MILATPDNLRKAEKYLAGNDKVLAAVIEANVACTLNPHREYYQALTESIIGQQLSVKAADSIERRFRELFDGKFPTPEQILTKTPEDLRAVGFSWAKAAYIRDLAQHIKDGKVRFDKLDSQSNQEIIAELTDVKGVGEWTAHMFLIFCLGRLDVLPTGDLGIRNGIRSLYGLDTAPSPQQVIELAERNKWHPYESVASWYIWRALDNAPA
jgi:DNA-3-methyladenine glycosylase II